MMGNVGGCGPPDYPRYILPNILTLTTSQTIVTVLPVAMMVTCSCMKKAWSGDTSRWNSGSAKAAVMALGSENSNIAQPSYRLRNSAPTPVGALEPVWIWWSAHMNQVSPFLPNDRRED